MLYSITDPGRTAYQPVRARRATPLRPVGRVSNFSEYAANSAQDSRKVTATYTAATLVRPRLPSSWRRHWQTVAEPAIFAVAVMVGMLVMSQWVNDSHITSEAQASHTQIAVAKAAAPTPR